MLKVVVDALSKADGDVVTVSGFIPKFGFVTATAIASLEVIIVLGALIRRGRLQPPSGPEGPPG